jgi:hypothetical protein
VSLFFGLVFLIIAVGYLAKVYLRLNLPSMGWFLAGGLIFLGVVGAITALVPHKREEPALAQVFEQPVVEQPVVEQPVVEREQPVEVSEQRVEVAERPVEVAEQPVEVSERPVVERGHEPEQATEGSDGGQAR